MLFCALAVSAAEPGQRAPGFALMDSKGDLHDLYDYRGKPVIGLLTGLLVLTPRWLRRGS